ncbi:uncharacterized protein [Watersipora subatra]|uniref:uncharacterized protein n=1 Tax=Watersipora subatra TaxID=2589382 RepID=UPI00355C924D
MRGVQRKTTGLQSIMDRRKVVTDDVTESDESSMFSDSSATTIPNYNGTWFDRSKYKQRRSTVRPDTTHSIISSSTKSKTTLLLITGSSGGSNTSLQQVNNYSSTPVTVLSAQLTATIAALGCVVLALLVCIIYFGYLRRKRWGSSSSLEGSVATVTADDGITNIGYDGLCSKTKSIGRLSIIHECTEEQEYEYMDSDKLSFHRPWQEMSNCQNPYEYMDTEPVEEDNHTRELPIGHGDDYEYVDPDKSSAHKRGSLSLIEIMPEDLEYVDPDKMASTEVKISEDPGGPYQDMVESSHDQHLYTEGDDYSSNPSADDEESEPKSEYDVIRDEQVKGVVQDEGADIYQVSGDIN